MTKPEKFLVEGVGKGSIPGCMDFTVIDDVIQVVQVKKNTSIGRKHDTTVEVKQWPDSREVLYKKRPSPGDRPASVLSLPRAGPD